MGDNLGTIAGIPIGKIVELLSGMELSEYGPKSPRRLKLHRCKSCGAQFVDKKPRKRCSYCNRWTIEELKHDYGA